MNSIMGHASNHIESLKLEYYRANGPLLRCKHCKKAGEPIPTRKNPTKLQHFIPLCREHRYAKANPKKPRLVHTHRGNWY